MTEVVMDGFYNDRPAVKVMDYKRMKLDLIYKVKVDKVIEDVRQNKKKDKK